MYCQEQILLTERETFRIRRLATVATILFTLWVFWALLLKFSNYDALFAIYHRLSKMTPKERFLVDIVPFWLGGDYVNRFLLIVANGVVFAPFGVLFQHSLKERNVLRDLGICFGMSLCIEVAQFFTLWGCFATTDLIMNTFGYLVGFAVYHAIFAKASPRAIVRFYHVFNLIVTLMLVFAVVTTINNCELLIAILTRTL